MMESQKKSIHIYFIWQRSLLKEIETWRHRLEYFVLSLTRSRHQWKNTIGLRVMLKAQFLCTQCQIKSQRQSFGWSSKGPTGGSDGKESACNEGDLDSIPALGRSPGEGNGSPCQYSCLGNSMDRGAWQATVHGVTKSWTQLSNFHFHLEKDRFIALPGKGEHIGFVPSKSCVPTWRR